MVAAAHGLEFCEKGAVAQEAGGYDEFDGPFADLATLARLERLERVRSLSGEQLEGGPDVMPFERRFVREAQRAQRPGLHLEDAGRVRVREIVRRRREPAPNDTVYRFSFLVLLTSSYLGPVSTDRERTFELSFLLVQ